MIEVVSQKAAMPRNPLVWLQLTLCLFLFSYPLAFNKSYTFSVMASLLKELLVLSLARMLKRTLSSSPHGSEGC